MQKEYKPRTEAQTQATRKKFVIMQITGMIGQAILMKQLIDSLEFETQDKQALLAELARIRPILCQFENRVRLSNLIKPPKT